MKGFARFFILGLVLSPLAASAVNEVPIEDAEVTITAEKVRRVTFPDGSRLALIVRPRLNFPEKTLIAGKEVTTIGFWGSTGTPEDLGPVKMSQLKYLCEHFGFGEPEGIASFTLVGQCAKGDVTAYVVGVDEEGKAQEYGTPGTTLQMRFGACGAKIQNLDQVSCALWDNR